MAGDPLKPLPAALRWLAAVRDVLAGPPGRRGYDKKRVGILLALLAIVQFGATVGARLLSEVFQAYDRAATGWQKVQIEQRHQEHLETLQAMRDQTAALKELAGEIRENSQADAEMRSAFWVREGVAPRRRAK